MDFKTLEQNPLVQKVGTQTEDEYYVSNQIEHIKEIRGLMDFVDQRRFVKVYKEVKSE